MLAGFMQTKMASSNHGAEKVDEKSIRWAGKVISVRNKAAIAVNTATCANWSKQKLPKLCGR